MTKISNRTHLHPFAGDDGERRGRPKAALQRQPPQDFKLNDELMQNLDKQGWGRALADFARREAIDAEFKPEDWKHLKRELDGGFAPVGSEEMDRLMCRMEPVAIVETEHDLGVALFNGRLVLEFDLACTTDLLCKKLKECLESARKRKPSGHDINIRAWANHRILALYELKLRGYDLRDDRKQLAKWLFPEIGEVKARGNKYDRARELLEQARSSARMLLLSPGL